MIEQKLSIEKREVMAKRNILSALVPVVDHLTKFNSEVKNAAKDAGLSEDYLRKWVKEELSSLDLIMFSDPISEDTDEDEDDSEEADIDDDEDDDTDDEEKGVKPVRTVFHPALKEDRALDLPLR